MSTGSNSQRKDKLSEEPVEELAESVWFRDLICYGSWAQSVGQIISLPTRAQLPKHNKRQFPGYDLFVSLKEAQGL